MVCASQHDAAAGTDDDEASVTITRNHNDTPMCLVFSALRRLRTRWLQALCACIMHDRKRYSHSSSVPRATSCYHCNCYAECSSTTHDDPHMSQCVWVSRSQGLQPVVGSHNDAKDRCTHWFEACSKPVPSQVAAAVAATPNGPPQYT
jgi:hypothetical protein